MRRNHHILLERHAPPGCYNFKRGNTAKFRNLVRSGGVVACICTSIGAGYGAAPVTQPTDGAQPFSWPAVWADKLRARGFNAYQTARWATSSYGTAGEFAHDPRCTIGSANWIPSTATFGSSSWLNSSDTEVFGFNPGFDSDTFTLWAQRAAGFDTIRIQIGGVAQGADINLNGAAAVVSNTRTATLADNRWDVRRTGVGTNFRIIGMEAYDSTIPNLIRVWNCSWGGSTAASWIDTANATRAGSVAQILPYDVVIIAIERNDSDTSVAQATYEANLRTMIGYVQTLGAEVLLAIEPGQLSSVKSEAHQAIYSNTVASVAHSLGLPYVSQRAWLGGGYSAGAYYDSTHPNAASYDAIASRMADLCQYLRRL